MKGGLWFVWRRVKRLLSRLLGGELCLLELVA